jgi:hypothetical protein
MDETGPSHIGETPQQLYAATLTGLYPDAELIVIRVA